jgi:hypothetical protein
MRYFKGKSMSKQASQYKKPISRDQQFLYLGRWVDKGTFRAFVYDAYGNEKLANNYNNFEKLIGSGEWFAVKPEKLQVKEKPKNALRADS